MVKTMKNRRISKRLKEAARKFRLIKRRYITFTIHNSYPAQDTNSGYNRKPISRIVEGIQITFSK